MFYSVSLGPFLFLDVHHQMGQHMPQQCCCNDTLGIVWCTMHRGAQLPSNDCGIDHDKYSNMLLTLGTSNACNCQSGTATWAYPLQNPGRRRWRYPGTNVLRQLDQHLSDTGKVNLRHTWMEVAHGLQRHKPMTIWKESRRNAIKH